MYKKYIFVLCYLNNMVNALYSAFQQLVEVKSKCFFLRVYKNLLPVSNVMMLKFDVKVSYGCSSFQRESSQLSTPVGLRQGVQPSMWMHLRPHPGVSPPTA